MFVDVLSSAWEKIATVSNIEINSVKMVSAAKNVYKLRRSYLNQFLEVVDRPSLTHLQRKLLLILDQN